MLLQKEQINCMWCAGLPKEDVILLKYCLKNICSILEINDISTLDRTDFERDQPALLWLAAKFLPELQNSNCAELKTLPKVLVFDPIQTSQDLDSFINSKLEYVARLPLDHEQVFAISSIMQEACNIHNDMSRITREIYLQRELVERKSEVLDFIHMFTTSLPENNTPLDILHCARTYLNQIFKLRSLHSLFWIKNSTNYELHMFLDGCSPESSVGNSWKNLLLNTALTIIPGQHNLKYVDCLSGQAWMPEQKRTLIMPLHIHNQPQGLIILDSPLMPLSKDQATGLQIALLYLSQAMIHSLNAPHYDAWTTHYSASLAL